MFCFDMPVGAGFIANLPTGGTTLLVHKGGGVFLSKVPPILFEGLRAGTPHGDDVEVAGEIPVSWDGETLPGDKPAQRLAFAFDTTAAVTALAAAADGGDTFAAVVLAEMERVDAMIAARQALLGRAGPSGVVVEPGAPDAGEPETVVLGGENVVAASGDRVDPADDASAAGVGSGA